MHPRAYFPTHAQMGVAVAGDQEQAFGAPVRSSVASSAGYGQVLRYGNGPGTFNSGTTFTSGAHPSLQGTGAYGWASASTTVVQDGSARAVRNDDGVSELHLALATTQVPRRGKQAYSVYDTHVHQRAVPGPRFDISQHYGFRSLFRNPSTGLISINFRNADGTPWRPIEKDAEGGFVKIESIECRVGNLITYEMKHAGREGGTMIWHGIVVQDFGACTVDVVRIVSGRYLKGCASSGLVHLELNGGLHFGLIEDTRYYRTDKHDVVKLGRRISVISEERAKANMIFEGPPIGVFWENDQRIRLDLLTS